MSKKSGNFFFVKISKLDDILKNFKKKRLPVSKKVVNLHPDTNQ